MTTVSLTNQTILDNLWNKESRSLVRTVFLAIVGSLVIWVSAKIQIPFYPVPVTMQTFVILTIGMVCGWRLGFATVMLYLAEGMVGLPVFAGTPAKGIGFAYMVGPTGGYLLGYAVAAVVVGYLAEKARWDRHIVTTLLAMFIGNLIIYALGLLWLGKVVGWDKPVLQWGLTPFLVGDAFKIVLAALLLPTIWKLIGNRNS